MNPWRYRLAAGLLIYAVMQAHAFAMENVPNSPGGMLLFHGSAALCDLMLIYCLPWFVSGELCLHLESSCSVSMICNAIGWFLYLAYAPPSIYNTLMWSITYLQWGRLLMADSDDPDSVGCNMVFSNHTGRV